MSISEAVSLEHLVITFSAHKLQPTQIKMRNAIIAIAMAHNKMAAPAMMNLFVINSRKLLMPEAVICEFIVNYLKGISITYNT